MKIIDVERAEIEQLKSNSQVMAAENSALRAEVEQMKLELDWQNNRNAGHPTMGGFEFYINEEWTGLASAALDVDYGWNAALRKRRMDPDDERVRVRRVIEDDAILKKIERLQSDKASIERMKSDSARLIAEVEQLKSDKAIVDWIEKRHFYNGRFGDEFKFEGSFNTNHPFPNWPTLRQAFAAMKKAKRPPRSEHRGAC